MKFLCDNCKAKYQLADDKVAGRTVRMKCRKCGHLIEVNASVTETSVATERPAEPAVADREAAAPPPAAAAPKPAAPPPRPGAPAAPPPRPSAARPAAPPKPAPPAPKPAGLAGAFSKAVADAPAPESSVSAAMDVLSTGESAEEWYVGINGVPVGPVRLTELRRKAASGAVTPESLVWREGFEEWVPLRTFPELAAMLADAQATGRASLTPSPPASPGGASTSSAGLRSAPARPTGRPLAPPPRAPTPRSNVVPITSRLATAEKLDEAPAPDPVPQSDPAKLDPIAPPAVASAPLAAALHAGAGSLQVGAESLQAGAGSLQAGAGSAIAVSPALGDHSDSIVAPIRRPKRRVHPAAWAVVALAGVLGGIFLGLSLAGKPKPQVQVVTVTVPAAATDVPPPPTATAAPSTSAATIDAVEVAGTKPTGGGSGSKAGEAKGPAPALTQAPGGPGPVGGLAGLAGLTGGPTPGPGGGTQPSGGGGALAQADIERVVQSHRAFVKRQCWEAALAAKPPSAPSSARVGVSITIAPDGHVSGASASGGDGYPGLASCVQGQVRNWRFPPSDGATVNVPFVFAAQ
jgi:predicted Zn finger-like uncharacterized protein